MARRLTVQVSSLSMLPVTWYVADMGLTWFSQPLGSPKCDGAPGPEANMEADTSQAVQKRTRSGCLHVCILSTTHHLPLPTTFPKMRPNTPP